MNQIEDKKIKDALLEGTKEVTELKNMVWSNIERELNLDMKRKEIVKRKRNKMSSFMKYGSIAAAITLVIGLNTEYGQAAVDKIKELFVPNKVVKQQIEGMDEDSNVALKEGSAKYIIYIDEERYTMTKMDGNDKIAAKIKGENTPEVFMEITQVEGKKPDAIASQIQDELKGKYQKVENRGVVNYPLKSTLIYANSGMNFNSTVLRYYLVDNTKGGTFVIKQQLFIEAEEGHGARMDNMLKEFKIIE
ncbi:hypothetical protein JOC70_003668 [Clostridium pascui]|uniref:hypothetical protein n=1 Tax=Clostridium pascui TaxID=46609 RepID=UPI00195B7C99|nr:hypothetical protein [Clostridium pascui]MBM7872119.1 hypothetical protein [Clostridium pascui]